MIGTRSPRDASFTVAVGNPLSAGLVAWWSPAYVAGSGLVYDIIGPYNVNLGTTTEKPAWSFDAVYGHNLSYDGGDYVRWNYTDFQPNDLKGTLAAWINCTNFAGGYRYIWSTGGNSGTPNLLGFAIQQTTGKPYVFCGITSGTYNIVQSDVGIAVGTWTHVALVSTGAAYLIYINGRSQALTTGAGANDGDWIGTQPSRYWVTIGAYAGQNPVNQFVGNIGDVMLWDRPLSPGEIFSLYDSNTRWALCEAPYRAWSVLPVAAPFNPVWAQRTNILLGGGVN